MSNKYNWKFANVGGQTRVCIESGHDLVNLADLDQKMWTTLNCPVNGLEFDPKTLAIINSNGDDTIRVDEVTAVSNWLKDVLKDPEVLAAQNCEVPVSAINPDSAEGAKVLASAKRVLESIGAEGKASISIADASDSMAIFSKTRFNGDGVITVESSDDEAVKATIAQVIAVTGAVADRSGADGADAAHVEQFYADCADYTTWVAAGEAEGVYPYGDKTAAVSAAYASLKDKVEDYFLRSSLIAFAAESASALDVSVDRISSISAENLTSCVGEIAKYPIARVNAEGKIDVNGINPAWKSAFAAFVALVAPEAKEFTKAQWDEVGAKVAAYDAWVGAKKGAGVEAIGVEAAKAALAADKKAELLALIEQDKALEPEFAGIQLVLKLLYLCRDFYSFVRNYVTFSDFFGGDKAVFQAGRLYIDQRSCDLCVKVSDMGKSTASAGKGGMYLIYCDCTSKTLGKKMTIAAAMTVGDISDLFEGKNCIFYDRQGNSWDAVVTKIIDNPISLKQAFFAPYRKLGKFITDKINKNAADKDAAAVAKLTSSADNVKVDGGAPKSSFDIAKFAGIFAAIGMALGFILDALVAVAKGAASLGFLKVVLVLVAIMLCISGPSLFITWSKLRKRNLAPLLNANGWAINSRVLVSIPFGQTLTAAAKFPVLDGQKKKLGFGWILLIVVVVAAAAFAALYFTNCLAGIGLPFNG